MYYNMTILTIFLILTDDKRVLLTVKRPEAVITVWEFWTCDMKKVT